MRTGIIGAGKVGCSLGKYFRLNDLEVTGYYDVNENLAKEAADFTAIAFIKDLDTIVKESDTLFLTVPDDLITIVWNQIKDMSLEGKFICHCSGALSSGDAFPGIDKCGAFGYSVHPLFAVSDKYNSYKELSHAYFVIEGDERHREDVAGIFRNLGNEVCYIAAEDKVKYHDDDEMWNTAEDALRKVLNDLGIEYTEEIGEAAFYGPKLDVNVKPAVGNEYTLSTCQLDFCLPAKFQLTYIDKDGEKKTPVVLHRAILGSLDRFMAYILEETKGNLPTWLAPVQVKVMPVKTDNEELMAYAHKVVDALDAKNVRVELDDRAEKLGYRMREGQVEKVPYLLVLGFNEVENNTVSYRLHGQADTTVVGLDEFVAKIEEEIKTKAKNR